MATAPVSRHLMRAFAWISGLVFVAGVIALAVTRFPENPARATNTTSYDPDYVLPNTTPNWTAKDVPREVQKVAADFILSAAGREDLEKAWALTHPDLKQGLTKQEWDTGNIPIQYYPSKRLDSVSYTVDELSKSHVVLTVALLPKEGATVKPQAFIIGLRKTAGAWLVDYWAPRTAIEVPAVGEGG